MSDLPCATLVLVPVSKPLEGDALRALLEATAPTYLTIPGLRRKTFLAGEAHAGGYYEWNSRASAEAFFDDAWAERMEERYGAVPTVTWFDLAAIVAPATGIEIF
ncbi:MAG: monooxygenase [Pseudomonadota bacterium]